MTRKKDDGLPPTQFLKTPTLQTGVDIGEFVDIDTGFMLAPATYFVGLDGKPMKRPTRLKLNEAMGHAARWWNATGSKAMPDRPKVKGDEYLSQYGVASGVLLGYPWEDLAKEEKLNVLRAWWLNIGALQFLGAPDASTEGQQKGVIH